MRATEECARFSVLAASPPPPLLVKAREREWGGRGRERGEGEREGWRRERERGESEREKGEGRERGVEEGEREQLHQAAKPAMLLFLLNPQQTRLFASGSLADGFGVCARF